MSSSPLFFGSDALSHGPHAEGKCKERQREQLRHSPSSGIDAEQVSVAPFNTAPRRKFARERMKQEPVGCRTGPGDNRLLLYKLFGSLSYSIFPIRPHTGPRHRNNRQTASRWKHLNPFSSNPNGTTKNRGKKAVVGRLLVAGRLFPHCIGSEGWTGLSRNNRLHLSSFPNETASFAILSRGLREC